jgi:exodeoxyribonuclease VII large subunit
MKEIPRHDAPAPAAGDCYTVTEIADAIRQHLESEFPRVNVIGEIANCKVHQSGHVYFTLRDSDSMLGAVLFRRTAERVALRPENGMSVVAAGRLSHFGGTGRTQIVVSELVAAGRGDMERSFRALLERLRAEGLTDPGRKRPPPPYPEKIAVVTSPTGAVLQDIFDTLRRRWPVAEIVHVPTEVQGPAAGASIVRALEACDAMDDVDTVILARGGGSVEDLWTFNLEPVARAVAASRHPLLTGIGHEIDTTICDYVSDVRAATPTAAAELATPRIDDVRSGLDAATGKIASRSSAGLENRRHLVAYIMRSAALVAIEHRVERAASELDDREERLAGGWRGTIEDRRAAIAAARGAGAIALERTLASASAARLQAMAGLAGSNPRTRIAAAGEALRQLARLMRSRLGSALSERRAAARGLSRELTGLDPRSVLKRGYAYCTTAADGRVVARAESLSRGDDMLVQFFDGGARCRVEEKRKGTPWRRK